MEFERIGKNIIRCHLSVEEMEEYGLHIDDFLTNQEKARGFLEELVERAEEEVGYNVKDGMVSMQLMRMPDDSLIITFSERGEEGDGNIFNQVRGLIEAMAESEGERDEEALQDKLSDEMSESYRVFGEALEEAAKKNEDLEGDSEKTKMLEYANARFRGYRQEVEKERRKKYKKENSSDKLFAFDSLTGIEDFVSILSVEKTIPSKLYRDSSDGTWYLLVKKGKLKLEEYIEFCTKLSEYGRLCTIQSYAEQYCKEHYICVINKHAIKALKSYVG